MSDTTPRSGLPLLAAAQAQKHVTHNEALLELDALIDLYILSNVLAAPPGSPSDGDAYVVAASPTGDWTGQAGKLAVAQDGAWDFYAPFKGLIAYVASAGDFLVYTGSTWVSLSSLMTFEDLAMLGINTAADSTNKLAVKSSALLFDNIGNGVQEKLNKHASTDTASLLYQTNYSGRAELGTTGDDNFHLKVSPDGSSWTEAMVVNKTTGAIALPNGSVSAPDLAFATNYGLYCETAPFTGNGSAGTAVSVCANGAPFAQFSRRNDATANIFVVFGDGKNVNNLVWRASADANDGAFVLRKSRGSTASPSYPNQNDALGRLLFQGGIDSTNATGATLLVTVIEPTPSSSAMGSRVTLSVCGLGTSSSTEVSRWEAATGLSMYGANPVIDQNRAIRLRATTIAGAITPAVAGNLFYHSDAQGGAGEVAVDTGSAYRHAGQAAVKRLTTDANINYTPRADGRIVRDLAALTANRKLVLLTTNVTDGHKAELSRRGSSGGFTRDVYQADGTTLIASLADNASADFLYDATAALWFQK